PLIESAAPLYRAVFNALGLPMLLGTFPGDDLAPLATPDGPVAAYLCYESVFPQVQHAMVAGGAELLINVTNDAWFARGDGGRQ
ncbi:apolipoprotein N-acyltransferase, partial [Enterococcus hirae]